MSRIVAEIPVPTAGEVESTKLWIAYRRPTHVSDGCITGSVEAAILKLAFECHGW